MPALLYVDTSALLDRVLGQKRHVDIAAAMRSSALAGGRLVASRLLHLETRRVFVRERLEGRHLPALITLAGEINPLPVTEDVWAVAHGIEQHTKALDSLHLATCRLVDAELLCSDRNMLSVAAAMGIAIHAASGSEC